jgi:NADH-quinone oxidoreductase subunit N
MTISNDVLALAPLIAAILVAGAILVVDLALPGRRTPALVTAFIGLGIVALLVAVTPGSLQNAGLIQDGRFRAFDGAYSVDALTSFLDLLFVAIVALTIAFAPDYLEERDLPVAEFAAVLVFAMSGAMILAASTDLLVLFLGLELMVLPGYLLAGYHKQDGYSTEGAIKYFLLGSFSSAILLFGLAFVWGITGTTRVEGVADALGQFASGSTPLAPGLAMGLAFLMTGVAFKIAAVPFHYWTPDAYQGSPTPVTGYLSVGPKVGAFALIIRLFAEALGPLDSSWVIVVIVLAATTMTLGNLVAVTQDNVKRMLAYSSIAHTGYMLVGLAAWARTDGTNARGMEGLLYYGAAYAFMNLGAFAVIAALQKRLGVTSSLSTFAGLVRREPVLAILMTLFLLSLTGIPPTAGFLAKAYVIIAAVETSDPALIALAVIAVLNAAVAAFYYLRVVVYMFMRDPSEEAPALTHGRLVWLGLTASTVLTVALGLFPGLILASIQEAARVIAPS